MGWCSATEIMDAALDAAEAAIKVIIDEFAPPGDGLADNTQARVDEALRPFVVTIAEKLRDGDWDCIDEADHFDQFQQEMLGYDDRRYEGWLVDRLNWADTDEERRDIVDRLTKLHEKMARSADGTG